MSGVDVSALPVLPPNSYTPLYVSTLGDDAIDLSAVCGLFLDDWQQEILRGSLGYGSDGYFSARQILALVPRQQGKAQALGTEILTANRGWQTIESLRVGDFVFRPSGDPVRVTHKSAVMVGHDCFRVTTTDDRSVVVDADHLWTVTDKRMERRGGFVERTLTTRDMFDAGVSRYAAGSRSAKCDGKAYRTNEYRFVLPRQCVLELDKRDDLPIDPYLFGAWLGDGSAANAQFFTGLTDFDHWLPAWSADYTVSLYTNPKNPGVRVLNVSNGLRTALREIGVLGNKHVPDSFLLAGDRQREALLQGLMDTDGSICVGGQAEFCNTNRNLAEAVLFLARSLGWRARLSEGRAVLRGKDCGPKYRVQFTPKMTDGFAPFRLERKLARVGARDGNKGRFTVSIKSIEPVESVPVQCLKVANDDGLYLAGRDLVATHNTVVLEARELAGLFLLQEEIMAHTAQEQRTAISSYRRLKKHIETGRKVLPHYDKIRWLENTTEISISLPLVEGGKDPRTPSRLVFAPRTPNALRGLTVDLLIVDEGYSYTNDQAAAIEPTQNQAKNPQLWLTSSTGMPESTELITKRNLGLSGDMPNLAFYEWKADDGSDPGDRAQWFKALPGLRTGRQRISEIEAQYLKAKAAADAGTGDFTEFNRELLGLWATTDVASTIPFGVWESQRLPDPDLWVAPDEFAFAVDVTPDTNGVQRASIYACGVDEFGFHHVWNVGADDDILWVAEFLKVQQEQRSPRVTVLDAGSPAAALMPMFDDLGVQYTKLSSGQCMAACSQFLAVVRDGRLRHGVDDLLDGAVRGGVQRFIGHKGAWLWARKSIDYDISPLVASSYALFGLTGVDPAESGGGWVW